MTVTVAQLIAKLQTLPQDAEVEVMGEVRRHWDSGTEYRALDLAFGVEVFDFTDRTAYPNMNGRVIVQLEAI